MMLQQLIILQIAAHLFADFILQSQRWSDFKSEKVWSGYHFRHILVVFTCSWLFSLDPGFWKAALLLTVLHLVVDMLKSYASKKLANYALQKYLFFIDQSIHLLILVLICIAYSNWYEINFLAHFSIRHLAIFTGLVLCAKPSNIIIKNILIVYSIAIPVEAYTGGSDKSIPNAGKLIGIVERFLAFVLILVGQFTALGFIIAAKSILRFSATEKNEYVLVGTLLSFGIAIATGLWVAGMA
jgi:hypothetical protein